LPYSNQKDAGLLVSSHANSIKEQAKLTETSDLNYFVTGGYKTFPKDQISTLTGSDKLGVERFWDFSATGAAYAQMQVNLVTIYSILPYLNFTSYLY
jgi:hypothetical protein